MFEHVHKSYFVSQMFSASVPRTLAFVVPIVFYVIVGCQKPHRMRDPKRNSGMFARGSLAMFFFSKVKSFSEEVDTWTGCFSYKSFFLIVHCILLFLGGGGGGGLIQSGN